MPGHVKLGASGEPDPGALVLTNLNPLKQKNKSPINCFRSAPLPCGQQCHQEVGYIQFVVDKFRLGRILQSRTIPRKLYGHLTAMEALQRGSSKWEQHFTQWSYLSTCKYPEWWRGEGYCPSGASEQAFQIWPGKIFCLLLNVSSFFTRLRLLILQNLKNVKTCQI